MRKKSQKRLFDNIFWYIIYLLPILAMGIFLAKNGAVDFSIINCFESLGISIFSDNIIYITMISIFGVGGVFPIFADGAYGLLMFASYYVCCFFVHMIVDVLLLLPRLVMNFNDKVGGED